LKTLLEKLWLIQGVPAITGTERHSCSFSTSNPILMRFFCKLVQILINFTIIRFSVFFFVIGKAKKLFPEKYRLKKPIILQFEAETILKTFLEITYALDLALMVMLRFFEG
jgi:large-conductance mechanosensitive channel